MNIYVGNLSYQTTDDSLREAFEAFGEVSSARVIMDRETGRSRGFGFVEMPSKDEGNAAIAALNGRDLDGRSITVNEARPKEEHRGPRGGGFRDRGDRGGRGDFRPRRY
ncbi:MAG TPA: RNA-binding protein [Candidatus Hydrogenedentes bacterium]|nr:RNA-binding protein [Candidatus Hydrogenedentota bacterium]HPU98996.1 RNA-binding protein [Candidatus Hydrogenedentota bacterium]